MTRETKIGLLVGLAFIIVVGILISDFLSRTNEAPAASLQIAGSMLRSGLGEPGGDDVPPTLRQPVAIVPRQGFLTREELTHHVDGGGVTLANPGNLNLNEPTPQAQPTEPNGNTVAERLRKEARARGEDVEPIGNPNNGQASVQPAKPTVPPVQPQPQTKVLASGYKALSGDTLGTIALRAFGTNNKANREAIVAANPSLQSNRNLIVAGRTYAIPSTNGGRTAALSPVIPVNNETIVPSTNDAGAMYVVQSGDTLWSIAVTELGNASEVATIKDLNQDLLGDTDQLRPNMKIRLPAKKIAAAN